MNEIKNVDYIPLSIRWSVERLRNNPKTVFKYEGIDGAVWAITLLFKAFVSEVALGYSDSIDVELFEDSGTIKISGKNRGLYIVNGGCIRARLYSHFMPNFDETLDYQIDESLMGARPGYLFNNSDDSAKAPENFDKYYDWTADAFFMLNFASEFFNVISCREGRKYHLCIENGKITSYKKSDTEQTSGTTVEFKLSNEVFGDIAITGKMLVPMIKYAAEKYPFARFSLNGERVVFGNAE